MNFKSINFQGIGILIIGDTMLDQYWHGNTSRISPEAPVPVVHIEQVDDRPGGAGNVACNLVALGVTVNLIAYCGQDKYADILSTLLTKKQILHHLIQLNNYPTITKLRILSRNQQLIRLDMERNFSDVDSDELFCIFKKALPDYNVVILSDYAKGTLANPQPYIQLARKLNIPVIVDPKRNDFTAYRGANLITPNFKEFESVVGQCTNEESLAERGRNLMDSCQLDTLVITRGNHGMTVIPKGETAFHLPAKGNQVYDVTGAGDTIISTLAACLAKKMLIAESAQLATIAAGIVVGKIGTSSVTIQEL